MSACLPPAAGRPAGVGHHSCRPGAWCAAGCGPSASAAAPAPASAAATAVCRHQSAGGAPDPGAGPAAGRPAGAVVAAWPGPPACLACVAFHKAARSLFLLLSQPCHMCRASLGEPYCSSLPPSMQAGMQRRIAERQKRAGRWLGGAGASQQRRQPPQQPPQAGFQRGQWQQAAGNWSEQQQPSSGIPQQQQQPDAPAAPGPDLGAFASGGLQRKVSRFAELANALRRSQQDRGAGLSWGRQQGGCGGIRAERQSAAASGGGWEQQLNVRRVEGRRTATPSPPQYGQQPPTPQAWWQTEPAGAPPPPLQQQQEQRMPPQYGQQPETPPSRRAPWQPGSAAVAADDEQLDW
jgi:hypothetical protein